MTKIIDWGFDLADFGSAKNFESVLRRNKLLTGYKKVRTNYGYHFTWKNKKVKLVTGNNPLTGEYMIPKGRTSDKGYASYIGITGYPTQVFKLKEDILATASVKDESKFARDYI